MTGLHKDFQWPLESKAGGDAKAPAIRSLDTNPV